MNNRSGQSLVLTMRSEAAYELPLVFRVPRIEHYAARFFSC
jgi:hypothetical protein